MNESQFGFIDSNYQVISDASLDASLILDSTGKILYANLATVHRYEYSLEELLQMNVSDLTASDKKNEVSVKNEELLILGEIVERTHRSKNGSEFSVEIHSLPIIFHGDQAIFSTVRDISQIKIFESALQNKTRLLARILDTEPGTVYIYDLVEHRNIYVNQHWLRAFGYSAEETQAMGSDLIQIFHPDDLPNIFANHIAWREATDGETRSIEYRIRNKEGGWHWLISQESPFARDMSGKVSQILGIAHDITQLKSASQLLDGQKRILEMMATGITLSETLKALVLLIESQFPGMVGSILLLDKEGTHVRHGAAPNLPLEFVVAVDGQPIGPCAGSCGTAAYRKEAVFVEDIATDPLWVNYKAAAIPHGLRASWSTPIFDTQGQLLGTFAMYYRQPGLPKSEHLKLINTATHIAAIAITRHQAEEVLHLNEERLRLALAVANQSWFDINVQTGVAKVGTEYPGMLGFDSDEFEGSVKGWIANIHPDDHDKVLAAFQACLASDNSASMEYRRKTKSGDWLWMHSIGKVVEWDDERKPVRMIGIHMDISKRKLAEIKVQRLTRLYAALSQCNQAIVRCTSEAELLPQICRDAVNFGGMKMAWIGMINEATKLIKPVASYGAGIEYLEGIEISLDAGKPTGQGPTGAAIRHNQPFWCQDFQLDPVTSAWHERGAKYGWGASASLPLLRNGAVIGAFTLYSDATNAFDEAAQNLLVEMAMDISFALERFVNENERKQEQIQLRKLSQVVEQSPNVIIITDLDAKIEYVNPAFVKTTGYNPAEVIGKSPSLLQSDKTSSTTYMEMWEHLKREESWHSEIVNKRKDGTEYIESVSISPMRGADGRVTHYLGIYENITEKKHAEERVQYLAQFDVLTGLPNRSQLDDHLKYALSLAKRSNENLALMFLDLDNFKDINDTLGHSIGDAVLIELAKRIKLALREEDSVVRLGGDEFILLLPGTNAKGAAQVAQKMLDIIEAPYYFAPHDLVTTASIGIAIYPNDGTNLETLSRNADAAMYRAKSEGRNGYRFFTQEMQARLFHNMQLVTGLRQALERDQLEVYYQPQVSLQNERIIGMEALLRWQHPQLGMVPPSEFIPLAESSGLILPIGEWVLRTAVKQAKVWLESGLSPLILTVNLSAVQFRHPDLPDLITRVLDEIGLPPEYLELELTESATMQEPLDAITIMNSLHVCGVRMSIDDFGTGYSSLSYLKKFKVYKLKIDQSFVRDISTDPEDKAIVMAIINLAKILGLRTIAEGVETVEQMNFLREQHCDEVQGYFYSKPLSNELFEKFVRAKN